jgi:hypothetical protein
MVEISRRRDSAQIVSGKAALLCTTVPLGFLSQKNSTTPISVRHLRLRPAGRVPYILRKLNLSGPACECNKTIHKIPQACDKRPVFPEGPPYQSEFLPATSKLFSSQLLPSSSSLEREKIIPAPDRHCGHVRTVLASQFGGILLLRRAFPATDIAHTAKVGPSTGT